MRVRCINLDSLTVLNKLNKEIYKPSVTNLTLNKHYDIIAVLEDSYLILNENGDELYYHKDRFCNRNLIIDEILK